MKVKLVLFALLALLGCVIAAESSAQQKVKPIEQIEKRRELSEGVWRHRWKFNIAPRENEIVLATFEVKPDEEYSTEGLPKAETVESILYVPQGILSESVFLTAVKAAVRKDADDPFNLFVQIAGFGHSFNIDGSLLDPDGGWDVTTEYEATKVFRFQDEPNKPTKRLFITVSMKRLTVGKAKDLVYSRQIELPELGDTRWSITLPPDPEKLEKTRAEQLATDVEPK